MPSAFETVVQNTVVQQRCDPGLLDQILQSPRLTINLNNPVSLVCCHRLSSSPLTGLPLCLFPGYLSHSLDAGQMSSFRHHSADSIASDFV